MVSEFVNDAGLGPQQVEQRYGKLLADLTAIGAEWIILTPHYVRPDWLGVASQRDIDADPRPYVAGLRSLRPGTAWPWPTRRSAGAGCGGRAFPIARCSQTRSITRPPPA